MRTVHRVTGRTDPGSFGKFTLFIPNGPWCLPPRPDELKGQCPVKTAGRRVWLSSAGSSSAGSSSAGSSSAGSSSAGSSSAGSSSAGSIGAGSSSAGSSSAGSSSAGSIGAGSIGAGSIASGHGEAAADRQRLPGDVGGFVGGEEGDRGRDIGGLADPAQRDGARQPVPQLLAVGGHLVEQRGVGRAGADAVHRNAVPGHLPGQRLPEGDDAALGGRVHRLARGADPAGVRGDVDDP